MTTVAIFCIGTELSRGELINGNAAWLSERMTAEGFEVTEHVVVDDDEARIIAAFQRLCAEHTVVLCTGGLGPTTDDLTSAAVAKALGVKLERDADSLAAIAARFARLGRAMSPSNEKQADFPAGAEILPNAAGTAPGFGVAFGKARAFFMPGVPREMHEMWQTQVLPKIAHLVQKTQHQIHLRTFGLPESQVGERLAGIEASHPGVILGYRAHFPEIEVKVLANRATFEDARAVAEAATHVVRERLGAHVFGGKRDTFAGIVSELLKNKGHTLAIAESCTGGMVTEMLTSLPGASAILFGGVVAYANEAKTLFCDVPKALIEQHGAVSEEVARALAEGVRARTGATIALSITGIAGPTGFTAEKPLGTVHLAVATKDGTVHQHHVLFPRDRVMVQKLAAYMGLAFLRAVLTP